MAANTVSAWTPKTVNKRTVWTSTIAVDTANAVAWTNKTPAELDPTRPWTLTAVFSGALDTQATPLALYYGYSDSAALSGTASVTTTDSAYGVQLLDDCGYTNPTVVKSIVLDPHQAVADVVTIAAVATGLKVKPSIAPYYLFNFTAGSGTLLGVTITLKIIQ